MDWLNYHHLYYFYTVVKEGGLSKAAEKLKLSPPTLHAQLKKFQDVWGVELFTKTGKKLNLTEQGRVFFQYADSIFNLGNELTSFVRSGLLKEKKKLSIGMEVSLYKGACFELLRPICHMADKINLKVHQEYTEQLLNKLASLEIDLLLTNRPLVAHGRLKVYNHFLGKSPLAIFSHQEWATKLKKNFPQSLNGVPFIIPTPQDYMRNIVDQWFVSEDLTPFIWAEIEGSALTKIFAAEKLGVMVAPVLAERELKGHNLVKIAEIPDSFESYYMVSAERKISNPLSIQLLQAHRKRMKHEEEE